MYKVLHFTFRMSREKLFGKIPQPDIPCDKCDKLLTSDEAKFIKKHDLTRYTDFNRHLCSLHWCACMPDSTPWSYLTGCSVCEKGICKTCRYPSRNFTMCSDCGDCLEKGNRIHTGSDY